MSENNFSSELHDGDSEQFDNDEYKYYNENNSNNVTYEDIDTFAHSRGREINDTNNLIILNEYSNFNNNNNIQHINHEFHHHNSHVNERPSLNIQRTFYNVNNPNVSSENILESSNFGNNYDIENEDSENIQNRNFETQLDDIFDHLTYVVSTEKQSLKMEKMNFQREVEKFNEIKKNEQLKLEKEKEKHKENLKIIEGFLYNDEDILDLDIGGTHKVTTSRKTLTKYPKSALAALFSGKYDVTNHNERCFIDRDGNTFMLLLNFLRSSKFPFFKHKNEEISFLEELEYWQINIKDHQEEKLGQFDTDWVANTLILENNNTTVKKQSLNHGILFCKNPMNSTNNFVEFKVTMNVPSRGKSHLFIGLVDKSKYKTENLTSTFWKDSPSSYYWDVWNTKLIKTDENGVQIGSISGYGCLCEEYETKISLYYDYKNKNVSFFKNGVNQGIAFRNVPQGLTPSLDLWFESGTIEILKKSEHDVINMTR